MDNHLNNNNRKAPSLRDFLNVVFKRKKGIVTLFLIIVVIVTAVAYIKPFTYQASTKILVKFDRSGVPLTTTSPQAGSLVTMRSAAEDIRTEMEILNNKYLIEQVVDALWDELTATYVDEPKTILAKLKHYSKLTAKFAINQVYSVGYKLDLMKELSPRQAKIKEIQNNLEIDTVGNSNVILVTYTSWNPMVCEKVVNKLTDFYLAQHINAHKSPRAKSFFDEQKAMWQTTLSTQEKALQDFKKEWSITSLVNQKNLLLESLAILKRKNDNHQTDISEIQESLSWLKRELQLRTNYTSPESVVPGVLAYDPVYKGMENDMLQKESRLKGLLAKNELQRKHLDSYQNRLTALNANEMTLAQMERDISISEDNYKLYLERVEESRISESLDVQRISNVAVIEPAIIPFEPLRMISFIPTRVLDLCVGALIGLLVGLAYAFLAEQMAHIFNSSDDLENVLGIPCVATIPKE